MVLLASLLLGLSVGLLIRETLNPLWIRFSTNAENNALKYKTWSDSVLADWSLQYSFRVALFVNGGIILGGILVFLVTGKIVLALMLMLAAYLAPKYIYQYYREKHLQRIDEQIPEAINIMVSAARAGKSLYQAIEDVVNKIDDPINRYFRMILNEINLGSSVDVALMRARDRVNLENFTMVTSSLIINSREGGDVLPILERIGTSTRELLRLKKKIITETTEIRTQQKVIIFMTPLFGLLVCFFDPGIPEILFNTFKGNLILAIVIILQIVAIVWIQRIIKATI